MKLPILDDRIKEGLEGHYTLVKIEIREMESG